MKIVLLKKMGLILLASVIFSAKSNTKNGENLIVASQNYMVKDQVFEDASLSEKKDILLTKSWKKYRFCVNE